MIPLLNSSTARDASKNIMLCWISRLLPAGLPCCFLIFAFPLDSFTFAWPVCLVDRASFFAIFLGVDVYTYKVQAPITSTQITTHNSHRRPRAFDFFPAGRVTSFPALFCETATGFLAALLFAVLTISKEKTVVTTLRIRLIPRKLNQHLTSTSCMATWLY